MQDVDQCEKRKESVDRLGSYSLPITVAISLNELVTDSFYYLNPNRHYVFADVQIFSTRL